MVWRIGDSAPLWPPGSLMTWTKARLLEMHVAVGEHVQLAAARAHFLQVGFELLDQLVVGRDGDDRHVFVHQRQRAVLEFAGGIGLGVDVGDFLELQGAFEGDRVMHAAAEKQRVMLVGKALRPGFDLRFQRQRLLHLVRQAAQGGEVGGFLQRGQLAAQLGQHQRQQEQAGELGGEGLGRGDADFGAGAGEELEARGAGERRLRARCRWSASCPGPVPWRG